MAALCLPGINLLMSLILFPFYALFVFFTNWCVMGSFFCILVTIYFSSWRGVEKHKKSLAALHLLLELSLMLNLVTVIMYWSVIHFKVIDNFSGWAYVHMFIVHIFPAFAYFMNAKVTRYSLCPDHWKLFVPIGLVYNVVNYFEVQRSGKPLYWFMTWKDWTSPAICIAIQVVTAFIWVGLSKLWQRVFGYQ